MIGIILLLKTSELLNLQAIKQKDEQTQIYGV